MKALVTVDKNWGIGLKGSTFVTIPNVQMLTRMETAGKDIIMSRRVAANFPGGLSPDRNYYILTRQNTLPFKGAKLIHSLEEASKLKDAYVLGGESIFRALLPYIDTVDVTYIDHSYEADAYFENLDENPDFKLTIEGEENTFFNLEYVHKRYERI